jgi:hypothetical protein
MESINDLTKQTAELIQQCERLIPHCKDRELVAHLADLDQTAAALRDMKEFYT